MFPFDKVKIDRSFVADMIANPQARAIIRSVIGLGHGLGVPVVAEGRGDRRAARRAARRRLRPGPGLSDRPAQPDQPFRKRGDGPRDGRLKQPTRRGERGSERQNASAGSAMMLSAPASILRRSALLCGHDPVGVEAGGGELVPGGSRHCRAAVRPAPRCSPWPCAATSGRGRRCPSGSCRDRRRRRHCWGWRGRSASATGSRSGGR